MIWESTLFLPFCMVSQHDFTFPELLGPESLISPALSTVDPLLEHTPLPTWAYKDGDGFIIPFFLWL